MLLSLQEIATHAIYIFILGCFLVNDISRVRYLALAACLLGIYIFTTANAEIQWEPFLWCLVFIIINIFQLIRNRLESSDIMLTPFEKKLQQGVFKNFNRAEIRSIISIASRTRTVLDDQIISKGENLNRLYLLGAGNVKILIDGTEVARLGPGNFIGEMSFLSMSPSTADVISIGPGELLFWDRPILESWSSEEPGRDAKLNASLGAQLAQQLNEKNIKKVKTITDLD